MTIRLYSLGLLIGISCSAQAGQLVTCPDLNADDSIKGWQIHGVLQAANFHHALISMTRVMGQNTVTCHYDKPVTLSQIGNFQKGNALGMWQIISIGGLSFTQCLASRQDCLFYSAYTS